MLDLLVQAKENNCKIVVYLELALTTALVHDRPNRDRILILARYAERGDAPLVRDGSKLPYRHFLRLRRA
jgi:hypothetical protein